MNAALGYSEKQTKQQELVIGPRQTTTDGKDAPRDKQDADELLGAPVFGQMAAWYLQREIAPEENPGNGTCLLRIQMQVSADSWQGKRDVGAIDKRDRVHDKSNGYDTDPSLRRRVPCHPSRSIGLWLKLRHMNQVSARSIFQPGIQT